MTAARVGRGRIEAGLVGLAGLHGLGEGVVDFEDGAFGAVVAVELGLVVEQRTHHQVTTNAVAELGRLQIGGDVLRRVSVNASSCVIFASLR